MADPRPVLAVERVRSGCSFIVQPVDTSITRLMAAGFTGVLALAAAASSHVRCAALLLLLLTAALILRLTRVTEESLVAMTGAGICVRTKRSFGYEHSRFIESAAIADIFIAEAVRLHCCHFYLAVLMRAKGDSDEPELVVPFRHLIPRLSDLQSILSGARMAVWGAELPEELNGHKQSSRLNGLRPMCDPSSHIDVRCAAN